MSPNTVVFATLAVVALTVAGGKILDVRAQRRGPDVATAYLAETGPPAVHTTTSQPRWLTAAIVVGAFSAPVAAGLGISSTNYDKAQAATAADQARSDEVAACRSEQRGGIDRAIDRLEVARSARDDAFLAGLVAAAANDQAALAELIEVAPQARQAAADALRAKERATRDYQAAVKFSRTDPDGFLAACRGDDPMPVADPLPPFTSCEEARLAGAAPLRTDDEGWNPQLDADGDGVACE